MGFSELLKVARQAIANHPALKQEIIELYELAKAEVEDGEDEYHECELAADDIRDLIKRAN